MLDKNNQTSRLAVVATPIGNLGDLTPRAREALFEAKTIWCEDTRRTRELLSAVGILGAGRLERMDAHASEAQTEKAVDRILAEGGLTVLVTDAGTPAVSDPGAHFVAIARRRGVRIECVPGVSSLTAFLSVSGLQAESVLFRGFFPRREADRRQELNQALHCRSIYSTIFVWFESPQRIRSTMEFLVQAEELKMPELEICVAKELTKVHELVFVGKLDEVYESLLKHQDQEGARGEWVLGLKIPAFSRENTGKNQEKAIGPMDSTSLLNSAEPWVLTLRCLLETGVRLPEASRKVSQIFGVEKKTVYESGLAIQGKKSPKKV